MVKEIRTFVEVILALIIFLVSSIILALNLQTNYLEQCLLIFIAFSITNSFAISNLSFQEKDENWRDELFISYVMLVAVVAWGMLMLFIFGIFDWSNKYSEQLFSLANDYDTMLHVITATLAMVLGWFCGSIGISDRIYE